MRVSNFDFELPRQLIATEPAVPRDSARLLVIGARLQDQTFANLPGLLDPGDVLVFNDTRVIPAKLIGDLDTAGGAAVEITLHKQVDVDRWRAFSRPARKLREGRKLIFSNDLSCVVKAPHKDGETDLRFNLAGEKLSAAIRRVGLVPLPPYISRPDGPVADDHERYQTVYAANDGAVAAPTAGLHFTEELFAALDARGVARAMVTLHVGAGTFLPVKVEDTADHVMHAEWGQIDDGAANVINAARTSGRRIVAVGTTSLRLLESAAADDGTVNPFEGETQIFITPGYRFKAADVLITNFHLPRSTLFMLVAAFAGLDRMKQAYEHAKSTGYRFYSYGDACLIPKAEDKGQTSAV